MEMNLEGITVKLEIRGYTKYDRESEEEPRWCRLDFPLSPNPGRAISGRMTKC